MGGRFLHVKELGYSIMKLGRFADQVHDSQCFSAPYHPMVYIFCNLYPMAWQSMDCLKVVIQSP